MATQTFSSREFNQNASAAKKASESGPVFITDRGRPAYVLLTIREYEKLSGRPGSILEQVAMPEADLVEFEIPKWSGLLARPIEFD